MRYGVSASQVYLPQTTTCLTIFDYFCQQFPHISDKEWQQRFIDGLVLDQTLCPIKIDTLYQGNQHLFYYRFLAHETYVPFEHTVLFENDALLVIDKPHFLTISPSGKYVQETLLVRLKHQTQNEDLSPIHRLDRETAGVVLFCKKPQYRALYQNLFAQHQIQKTYHAIAPYCANITFPQHVALHLRKGDPFYTMQVYPQKAPNSETTIVCLEHNEIWAKYELYPKTGKQHQLRVHLNYLGLPIKNDPFYPTVQHKAEDDFSHPLQLLAKHIQFIDPVTQKQMAFTSQQSIEL